MTNDHRKKSDRDCNGFHITSYSYCIAPFPQRGARRTVCIISVVKLVRNASKGKRVVRRLGILLVIAAICAVAGWLMLDRVEGQLKWVGAGLMFLGLLAVKDGIDPWFSHFRGDQGEEELIKKLELLGDEYTVITNWQPPGEKRGDVDIIVLGPHGVAALECKRFANEFGCDGDYWFVRLEAGYKKRIKSLSSQTRGHAQCIKRHLKRQGVAGEVHAALCFRSLRRASITNPMVKVIDYDDAVDFIYSLPRVGEVGADHFVP
jgi:hypothetical protein